jgi:hypothetical protein
VLKGHADEYSNPVPGSITGCSPITPLPLHKGIMISLFKNKKIKTGYLHEVIGQN